MSREQSLAEELNQIRYPLEDSNVVEILLIKLRHRSSMLLQERVDIEARIDEANAALMAEQEKEQKLYKEYQEQCKEEQESRELIDFIKSFHTAKPVTVDGLEIIADLWRTRAQEDEHYTSLQQELKDLKAEELELTIYLRNRFEKFFELSQPLIEILQRGHFLDGFRLEESNRVKEANNQVKESPPGSTTPEHSDKDEEGVQEDKPAEDADMDTS